MSLKDALLGAVIVIVWGLNFVVIAVGLKEMPPLLMGGLRFLLVAVIGCWFVARPNIPLKWFIAYGLSLSVAQFALLFIAMSVGMPAGLASLVLQSQILFTLMLAFWLLKEQIKMSQIIAIGIAAMGLLVIGSGSGEGSMSIAGFILSILAAFSWALGNVVTKKMVKLGYKTDLNLVIWSALFSCLPFFILSLLVEGPDIMLYSIMNFSVRSVLSLLYLALVATLIGYGLWSYLLSHYDAGKVAPLTLGVPVIGLISATLFLDEKLSQLQMLGISLVMLALMVNIRLDKYLMKRVSSIKTAAVKYIG